MQNVEDTIEVLGLFDGGDVGGFFDHADKALVARGTGAVNAGIDVGDVVAHRAEAEVGLHVPHSYGEGLGVFVAGAKNVKGQPLGAFRADSGELFQQIGRA